MCNNYIVNKKINKHMKRCEKWLKDQKVHQTREPDGNVKDMFGTWSPMTDPRFLKGQKRENEIWEKRMANLFNNAFETTDKGVWFDMGWQPYSEKYPEPEMTRDVEW